MKYSIVFAGALALSTALAAPSPVFVSDNATAAFANETETSLFNTTGLTDSEIASTLNGTHATSDPFINLRKKYKFGNYDGTPWTKATDAAERAFSHLCPEEHDNGRSCIGQYVNNGRYRHHFDRDLHMCMKTLMEKCNKWDAKNKYCAIRTIDHVKLAAHGKGMLREMYLHASYTGKGKPKYWWKRNEAGDGGEEGEEIGQEVEGEFAEEFAEEFADEFAEEFEDEDEDDEEEEEDSEDEVEKSDIEERQLVSSPPTEDMDAREIEKLTKMLEKLRQQVGDDGKMAIAELLEALTTAALNAVSQEEMGREGK
jgi:hypothetical protein